MSEAEHQEEEDLEYVAVTDDDDEQQPGGTPPADDREDVDDEEGEEDSRLGAGEPDEDEAKKQTAREQRRSRRQRQKQARERDQKEMRFLRTDNERMDRENRELRARVDKIEAGGIDSEIARFETNIRAADNVMKRALEAGKHEDVVEAMRIRDELRDGLRDLRAAKDAYSGGGGEYDQDDMGGEQPRTVPQAQLDHARTFIERNSWWDPNGGDQDSLIVSAIDKALFAEGWDPTSADYWDEFQDRVEERLPHRFKGSGRQDDDDNGRERGGSRRQSRGPRMAAGGQDRPLKPGEVYISAERKQAMIDAGVWEDKDLRAKYLKQYADWDREHGDTV